MSNLKETFSDIYNNWGFGGHPESRSGPGSTLYETDEIRAKIRSLVTQFKIKTVVDLPCGDFNWMKEIVYGFEHYLGCDIVPDVIQANKKYSNTIIDFREFDLTGDEPIPEADLLIVRDVIGHLPLEKGKKAIQNILTSKCKYLLSTTWYNINDSEYYKTHTGNREVTPGAFYPVCLLSEPFNLPAPEFYLEEKPIVDGYEQGNRKGLAFWDLTKIRNKVVRDVNTDITIVTGLWNINRTGRSFDLYIENFKKFLKIPVNMFIYVPKELEYLVWQYRDKSNTHVRIFELDDIKNNLYAPFWDKTQQIRTNPDWLNITGESGWLKSSPQAVNEWYNPIVQSKMFMLHDAKIINPFNTDYFAWLDAGINNTIYERYFTDARCLDKLVPYLSKFLFLSYPYESTTDIHGFSIGAMNAYANAEVSYVCRGGLFGGHKDYISLANGLYYSLLNDTLSKGYMGTEESIFTIMSYLQPSVYRRFMLNENGLIVKFIHAMFENTVTLTGVENNSDFAVHEGTAENTTVYVLSFNFPHQFQTLLNSFEKNPEWLAKPRKVLINNSNDPSVLDDYQKLCEKYNFEHIKTGENLGINRGRLYAAKHFQESNSKHYFFFEDDMTLNSPEDASYCRNGFRKYVPNLYDSVHKIMSKENFDFLKLSFTEVYMDNHIQVSWYNVPQEVRTTIWPNYDTLPTTGLDPNAPRTQFNTIDNLDDLSYISGEIYYANWPMIVNRAGNYKMFLETEWQNPYEQTWMSYMFQKTREKHINPAVLLASPINHNRIAHYTPQERREN